MYLHKYHKQNDALETEEFREGVDEEIHDEEGVLDREHGPVPGQGQLHGGGGMWGPLPVWGPLPLPVLCCHRGKPPGRALTTPTTSGSAARGCSAEVSIFSKSTVHGSMVTRGYLGLQ